MYCNPRPDTLPHSLMLSSVVASPGRARVLATWLIGSSVIQFAIAYQMWGERGVQNRVRSECVLYSQSYHILHRRPLRA